MAILCLDGNNMPPNIFKRLSYSVVLFQKNIFLLLFLETDFLKNPLSHYYSTKAIIKEMADNRLQAPKHKTLTFAQKWPEPL